MLGYILESEIVITPYINSQLFTFEPLNALASSSEMGSDTTMLTQARLVVCIDRFANLPFRTRRSSTSLSLVHSIS